MSSLQSILATYRALSKTEREKGSYFEELIRTYFRNAPRFADLYSDVWLLSDWAHAHGFSAKDTGIDLVASLNLLSQTLTEWTQESAIPLHSFAVCSDVEVGKKRSKDEDIVETLTHELRYPATTDAKRLAVEMAKPHDAQHLSVVFSTYHSLDVISRASKRLYMTATPRINGDMAKATAEKDNTALYDMNDEAQFGKQLHVITFSEAVQLKLHSVGCVMRNSPGKPHYEYREKNTPCYRTPNRLASKRFALLAA